MASGFGQKGLPGGRKRQPPVSPAKERDAQLRLKGLNLLAERRLRHVKAFCGPVHVHLFSHRNEMTHQTKLHKATPQTNR